MKPVMMTKFGMPRGNCFQACLASIFEVPLADVPEPNWDEIGSDEWAEPFRAWLARRGMCMVTVGAFEDRGPGHEAQLEAPGYCIMNCLVLGSPELENGAEWRHAVVTLDGRIVHNPQGEGLNHELWPREYHIFQPIDFLSEAVHE